MGDTVLIRTITRKLLCLIIIIAMLTSFSFFVLEAEASPSIIKIMPLGDSITVGYPGLDSYRTSLFLDLFNSGYNVNFVGTQNNGTGLDNDNEGHLGYQTDQIRDNVIGWLNNYPADNVLLHTGTNDIESFQSVSGIISEVNDTLNNIDHWESDNGKYVTVILARIILRGTNGDPSGNLNATTKLFDDALQTLALSRIAKGDRIVVVDMENALSYSTDLVSDGIHPNFAGYEKMADVWYNALVKILGYSLTVNYVGHGVVTKLPEQVTYPYGAVVNLTAKADDGWTFSSWSGDLGGSVNTENITMDSNKTVTATFNPSYKLTITTNFGATTPLVGEYWYAAGTNVTIAASSPTAGDGERFSWLNWTGDGSSSYSGTNNTIVVTMNSSVTETAFWQHEYKLMISSNSGTTQPPNGENWFAAGALIAAETSSPTDQTGVQNVCLGWTGIGSVPATGTSSNVLFSLMSPSSISWIWKTQYYLTVSSTYGNAAGTGWYDAGASAYASVSPTTVVSAGGTQYSFTGWSGSASGSSSNSNALIMDSPKTAMANWSPATAPTPTPPQPTPTPSRTATPKPSATVTESSSPTVSPSPTNEPTASPPPNSSGVYTYVGLAIGVISLVVVVTVVALKLKNRNSLELFHGIPFLILFLPLV
jgi:lysophospholipase L1-like esterase